MKSSQAVPERSVVKLDQRPGIGDTVALKAGKGDAVEAAFKGSPGYYSGTVLASLARGTYLWPRPPLRPVGANQSGRGRAARCGA